MAFIFWGSTGTLSSRNTSRFLGPLLRWIVPDISDVAIKRAQFAVRKCAHLAEYALLAGLCWVAIRRPVRRDPRPWNWREARWAFALAAVYALTDEFHQSLVPSRFGSPWDVVIDCCGAALGLGTLWAWHRWRRPGVS